MRNIDHSEVCHTFDYDMDSGLIYWRVKVAPKVLVGAEAGWLLKVEKWTYVCVSYAKGRYMAHDIAWMYMTGSWPAYRVDHRNGDGVDNSWYNLREATAAENSQNLALSARNTSGYRGVNWMPAKKKWRAEIGFNRKNYHLGLFETVEQARDAYLVAKAEMHLFQPIPR